VSNEDEKLFNRHMFERLFTHVGHNVVCVQYGNEESGVVNVAIECVDCATVLYDVDTPENSGYVKLK